ncbi:MAG: hypothetical protein JXA03_15925 [Bacteroidales bacterium]|nr:hypothetical protein [Bacteroidales bacterium]
MATKQEIQLEILNLEYSRFVKDQVLTEVQLNEIIDFFEDQHRVTRTCLIGTGIVCGLPLTRHNTTKVIKMGAGVAITTDGDLLKITDTEFKYFRDYAQPDGAHYDPFYYKHGLEEKFITLFELLTEEQKDGLNSSDYGEIKDLDGKISNWVAILYLEYYLKDPENCTPTDCDNMGSRQVAKPKVLVLSKTDMDKMIHKDTGETIGDEIYLKYRYAYDKYFSFPVIKAKRVVLNQVSTLKSTTLAGAYYTAAKNGSTVLVEAIKELYDAFRIVLDKNGNLNVSTLTQKLKESLTTPSNTLYGQYTYDYYKDVIAAYNELREILYTIGFECCADIHSFPKHIMLGAPNADYGPASVEYRHRFYPSPVQGKKEDVNLAITLMNRLKSIIQNFNPVQPKVIKVTPSMDYDRLLSDRAIPFYFKNTNLLVKEWNYSRTLKGQEKLNLSYNAGSYDSPVPDHTLNPLDYDIDANDFFRVEGHIGMEWKEAMKMLEQIRKDKAVPIDIVAVRMGDVKLSDINLKDFDCHFQDLNATLNAFQAEINCLLAEGAVFFSGFTANKEKPHINLTRYIAKEGEQNWIITKFSAFTRLAGNSITGGIESGSTGTNITRLVKETIPSETKGLRANLSGLTAGFTRTPSFTEFCDPFIRPPFRPGRIIKDKIDTDPTVFGRFYAQVLEEDMLSVDDFTEKARALAAMDADFNKLTEDERYVVFEYPTILIGSLNYLQRFVPGFLWDINNNLIDDYREFAQKLCRRIKTMHTRLEKYFKTTDYMMRGHETRYINMLNNLEKLCCGYEKLEVIMREIEKRKQEILKNLSFTKYAADHPGLEHKAGVHRGGTFVIVYEGQGKKATITRFKRELKEGVNPMRKTTILPQYRDIDSFAYYIVSNGDTVNLEEELAAYFEANNINTGSVFSERLIREINNKIEELRKIFCAELNPPDRDIVVADFCLPYLCCTDCPPVAFIIPAEKKSLALPTDIACNNQDPITFTAYSPKDAVITSPEADDAIIPGDPPSFDPAKVPEDQLGKTITFTLNGELMECTIVVYKKMELELSFKLNDTNEDAFTVDYINQTDESQSGERIYLWKFNVGLEDFIQTGTGTFNIKYSRARLAEMGISNIEANISVKDDPCHSTGELTVEIPEINPGIECPEFVRSYIDRAIRTFITEAYKERVAVTQSPQLMELYSSTNSVLTAAQELTGTNRSPLEVIINIHELLQQIYSFTESFSHPDIPRILEELLHLLLLLMLNLVRCIDKIPDRILTIIVRNLKLFMERRNFIRERYLQLDLRNVLEDAVKDFAKNFVSQDIKLNEQLETLISILKEFPEE